MNETLETLNRLLEILGNVSLKDAVAWAEVEENAMQLRAEGHEGDPNEN